MSEIKAETEIEGLRAALEWYAERAEEMQIHALRIDTKAMMATMQVLSLDGGKRARDALNDG